MDNLIVLVPFGLGLTLFSALWAAEKLSARRYQRRIERRLRELSATQGWDDVTPLTEEMRLKTYSLTYPRIPRPYQRKVR